MSFTEYVKEHLIIMLILPISVIYGTWTFGTFFSDYAPSNILSLKFFAWVFPALMSSLVLNIGLVKVSDDIIERGKSMWRVFAFLSFAFSVYCLWWAYIVAHFPEQHIFNNSVIEQFYVGVGIWVLPSIFPIIVFLHILNSKETTQEIAENIS